MSISIIGAGAYGTALAVALSKKDNVTLWGRNVDRCRSETPLPNNVYITRDIIDLKSNIVILAIPAQKISGFLKEYSEFLSGRTIVSCSKGIELSTLRGPSSVIKDYCPSATVAVLTGPSFATDISSGTPTALTIACADASVAQKLQSKLSTNSLRLYRTSDLIGAELGGALKNVVAIAAGAVMGAGYSVSSRASIISRGFSEMTRVATFYGARIETLIGLSGLGDLILTSTSEKSRNFCFGYALGRGDSFASTITVEGIGTAHAMREISSSSKLDLPIAVMVSKLCNLEISMEDAIFDLLNRPLREE